MTKADKEGQRKAPILRFKGFTNAWEQRQLGKQNKITMGQSPSSKNYTDNPKDWILIQGNADLKSGKVAPRIYTSQLTKKADIGDIILTVRAPVGEVAITDYDAVLGRGVAAIKGNLFIYFALEKFKANNKWNMYSSGSTFDSITGKDLNNLPLFFPSETEENKIGVLLNKLDNLLALYAKKSSCLDSCIAYFIRILYDDPQFFKQKNVQNSIIKSFKLDDILIKNNAKNKDLSILNVESISNKKGFISQKEQFDNYQVASKDLSNYYVIHPKDFAYNPSRINVGSIAYKSPNDVKGIVSPLYVSFKCKNDIVLDKYLWHWFKSTNFEHQRVRLSEGGVRDILSFNQLSKMKISIPSFEIQRQTINLLEILIQYKEEVDLKLNNLKLIKNTLLQSMFL